MNVLKITDLSKNFGGIKAIQNLDLHVDRGEIVAIIGPNGAGKTTVFNCICGTLEADDGKIELLGENITNLPSHVISQKGVLRTFQQVAVFDEMTLLDNMLVAQQHREENLLLTAVQESRKQQVEKAVELLDFVNLAGKRGQSARELSYGQKKLLEFAMSFMPDPKVFLLDEPLAGVNPTLINQILGYIRKVREDFNISILLIEHNMQVVMEISERIYVLAQGKCIAVGSPSEVQTNELVIEAYFGGGTD